MRKDSNSHLKEYAEVISDYIGDHLPTFSSRLVPIVSRARVSLIWFYIVARAVFSLFPQVMVLAICDGCDVLHAFHDPDDPASLSG